jgi:hypothetical protein
MSFQDIDRRFDHHPPKDEDTIRRHTDARAKAKELAEFFEATLLEGREKSVALTKLEEALMWANASIARQG